MNLCVFVFAYRDTGGTEYLCRITTRHDIAELHDGDDTVVSGWGCGRYGAHRFVASGIKVFAGWVVCGDAVAP